MYKEESGAIFIVGTTPRMQPRAYCAYLSTQGLDRQGTIYKGNATFSLKCLFDPESANDY